MAVRLGQPFSSLCSSSSFIPNSRISMTRPCKFCMASHHPSWKRDYTSVMIVPTGVGASIGGYAGDALPVARTLSSVVDCLISHPNVLNAAMLYWPMPNVLYVEGHALDRFAEGLWALQPVHQNKVGLVLDAAIEEELQVRHLQVADATRASLGLPVLEYIVTDTALEVEKWIDPENGHSTGRIKHPGALLRAVQTLVSRAKVNAVAVVGRFPDDDLDDTDDYRQGMGIDDIAGVEALISHLVVKEFQLPCAHAPAMSTLPLSPSLSPKSAAEEVGASAETTSLYLLVCMCMRVSYLCWHSFWRPYWFWAAKVYGTFEHFSKHLGYTFLPCVLAGLSNAPQYLVDKSEFMEKRCILGSDVDSVILPIDACGGDGALAFARRKKKPLIIVVEENETVLNDTPDKLQIEAVKVSNYWEAIGVIAAHKAGVLPDALRRNRIGNICSVSAAPHNGCAVASNASSA